ncbi:DEAD/DEAH box helicase [Streptomyces melanogenes]|uniref:DEAD/DEAH box helicase n=1 Tax=Streptomyces melanogenes TaxID=67326 RepID=UPI0037B3B752
MRDSSGTVRRLGDEALARGEAAPGLRAQLRSHVLGEQISSEGAPAAYTYDTNSLRRGLTLAQLGQLARTPRERRAEPGPLTEIAQAYADLAERHPVADPARIELLAIAATMWSLAGYQANSTTLATAFRQEADTYFVRGDIPRVAATAPYRIASLTGSVLQRDIDEVARLGALSGEELPDLGRALVAAVRAGDADQADLAVLAAYGLAGRAARSLTDLWRSGNRAAGRAAVADLRKAAAVLLDASVVDTWTLVDSLAHAVEDIVATSPWLLLRRAAAWGRVWERYLRALIVSGRPMTQVWPSQRAALEAGLVDAPARSMAVTMPTSAGKTHIAEWAILHALAPSPGEERMWRLLPDLAVYVVPTRALAAQVERHLGESLELVGLRVSSLFGGAEHVRYEAELLQFTDVLVVTSEKLDLLLRNEPELAARLRLVLVDEGHALDRSERGLRLEMLLTRIRRLTDRARIVLLSAVLPNGDDLARWLEPAAGGSNHAQVDWSPSQLRTGVFSWRGPEKDGQSGAIDYGNPGTGQFFLPRVLTRHLKRVNLFPTAPKDVAAALALHFDRLGPVLISSPTKIKARAAARAVGDVLDKKGGAPLGSHGGTDAKALAARVMLSQEIAGHLGDRHELVQMVLRGYAYHHSEVPQAVRHLLERAYRDGALRILCATSTLSQGMNLPTKTVLVPDTYRSQHDQVSVRDFWNTAGRAGRAFQETEGHVILIARDAQHARELRRRYLDRGRIEPVISTLAWLYFRLAAARLGARPVTGQDLTALELGDPGSSELAMWAEALDIQLLAQLAEEVVDTPDQPLLEQAAHDLLSGTLGSHQIGAKDWSLAPLTRFAARRVAAIARRLPDPRARAAIVRTGLSITGGIDALAAADRIIQDLTERPALLHPENWPQLRDLVLSAATGVHELQAAAAEKKAPLSALGPAAADWIAGRALTELHDIHQQSLGTKEITGTAALVDRVITHDLAWVVSAILQIFELRSGAPAEGNLAALPAMLKYGVATPAACYAASLGIQDRTAAMRLAARCPHPEPTFYLFLDWLSALTTDEINTITTPDMAALLIRSAERRNPHAAQNAIIRGQGTFTTPLRGIRHAGSAYQLAAMAPGTPLELIRDRTNPSDPNAIRVEHDTAFLGWIARDIARPLALALDDSPTPAIRAHLATDTRSLAQDHGMEQLRDHDQIHLTITLGPA